MKIDKIDFHGHVSKVSGRGSIDYYLWVDAEDRVYVQFHDNDRTGTFSSLLFPVEKYESKRNMRKKLTGLVGYDLESHRWREAEDFNNGAFLKAVLRDVIPEEDL